MAVLNVSEITESKSETVMFFGEVMTDLANEAFEESKAIIEGEAYVAQPNRYYRSSTPLIAVVKYLKQLVDKSPEDPHPY
jgi:hypothetical protein